MLLRMLLVCLALLAPTLRAAAAPADAVRAGSMDQMIPAIIAIYEDAGLSWDHGIDWQTGPYTTSFWYFDPWERNIVVGAVPRESEVAAYWQNWSKVLTDSHFVPATFFTSAEEARQLAHYNQFVLATHESAHAITFRYDYGHLERHAYAVNCREYYADRLTVAILNEQARIDPDMARWRARYFDLVRAMGDTIPAAYRFHIADFAALDADCALIDVAQPTPDTMQPYASAYFERYRVLLEAALPPMESVFATHLVERWNAAQGAVPFAPNHARMALTTLGAREEVSLGPVFGPDTNSTADDRTRVAAFDPQGTLWFASLAYDPATRLASLTFGADPEESAPLVTPAAWHRPSRRLELGGLAVLSPRRFVVAVQHFETGNDDTERHFVTFLLADGTGETWSLKPIGEREGIRQATILRAPDDRLHALVTPDPKGREASHNWVRFELTPGMDALAAETPVQSAFALPRAIDGAGRLYEESGYMLWGSTAEGTDLVLAGNGHMGPRDGTGIRAELSEVQVVQFMPDSSALLIDRNPRWDGWQLRQMRPLP